jgi:hypothetical protein
MSPMNQRTLRPSANLRYWQRVKNLFGTNLIGYWPMGETSGTDVVDLSGNGHNGTYALAGVTLANTAMPKGGAAPLLDGTGYINLYSAGLAALFNGQEITLAGWAKASAGAWGDANFKELVRLLVNGSHYIILRKGAEPGKVEFIYTAGGTTKSYAHAFSGADWFSWGLTASLSGDVARCFIDGVQVGGDLNGLGAWAGAPGEGNCLMGAADAVPNEGWQGWLAHGLIATRAASVAEMGVIGANP